MLHGVLLHWSLSFFLLSQMEGDIIHSMEDVLIERYGVNLAESSQNRMVTDMWNWLQREVSNTEHSG